MSETPAEPLPLPVEGPATLPGVKALPTVGNGEDVVDAELQVYVNAINGKVRGWPCADQARGQATWPAEIVLGATMLVARVWRRRDTPAGVEVFGDNAIAFVRRNDPDVALLLDLGDYAKPAVG